MYLKSTKVPAEASTLKKSLDTTAAKHRTVRNLFLLKYLISAVSAKKDGMDPYAVYRRTLAST